MVSEALTNVAKHARATSAEVDGPAARGPARVVVTDDGRGGADPGAGHRTARPGPAGRLGGRDLHIDSPPGGPTTIRVELPCE